MPDRIKTLGSLKKALAQLEVAVASPIEEPRDLAGIVKSFEFVFELSWKAIQAAAREEGRTVTSPRNACTEAFRLGWIEDPVAWGAILEDRNRTVHTYDEDFARRMCERIMAAHLPAFRALDTSLSALTA